VEVGGGVVVVLIDLVELEVQAVFVVTDTENVDCNYYVELDNKKMREAEMMMWMLQVVVVV
jgi:hypothetical protein